MSQQSADTGSKKTSQDEIAELKQQARFLSDQLKDIEERIKKIKGSGE